MALEIHSQQRLLNFFGVLQTQAKLDAQSTQWPLSKLKR
jgi:hypothetical protein